MTWRDVEIKIRKLSTVWPDRLSPDGKIREAEKNHKNTNLSVNDIQILIRKL